MSDRLKIMEINSSSDSGGGSAVMFDIVNNLKNDFEFVVVAPQGPYIDKYQHINIRTHILSIRSLNPILIFTIKNIIKNEGINLVHTHGKGAGIWGRLAAYLAGVPVLHTFHGIHYKTLNPLVKNFYLLLEKFLSKLTDLTINVSGSEKNEGLSLSLYSEKKSKIILNGIEIPKNRINQRSINKIINIGNIGQPKNQIALVRIVQHLPSDIHIYIVGRTKDQNEVNQIKNEIKVLGLKNRVHLLGEKTHEEVINELNTTYIYLSTSLWEGLPLTLLEAGSLGIPIVASRVVGHTDVIEDGQTGFLFDLNKPQEAVHKIKLLLNDSELYGRISKNIQHKIIKDFSLDKMVNEHRELYNHYAQKNSTNK